MRGAAAPPTPGDWESTAGATRIRARSVEAFALRVLCSRWLLAALVATGILVRVVQYAANRSLWVDEASLAVNLIDRPLTGLVHRLDFSDAAPIGFVLIEGVVAKTLGYAEYVLRLVPMVAGVVSIPAFAWLARRLSSQAAAAFATLLFAVAGGLVYYSSELKPYESDVAATVLLLILGIKLLEPGTTWTARRGVGFTLTGLALLATSFSAIFVVAGVSVAYLATVVSPSRRDRLGSPASVVVAIWILASLTVVGLAESNVSVARQGFESESGRFLGVPGSSPLHAVNYMGTHIVSAIGFSQQSPYSQLDKLALALAAIGALQLLRTMATHAVMLLMPFPLLLVAAGVHAYPISERTELFLVPAVLLLIAVGTVRLIVWLPRPARFVAALTVAAAVAGGPVSLATARLAHPQKHEEVRPVLQFIRAHWRAGDSLYVHFATEPAFLYYVECKCVDLSIPHGDRPLWPLQPIPAPRQFDPAARPLSRDVVFEGNYGLDWDQYLADVHRLGRRRYVWFLYGHFNSAGEQQFVQDTLLKYLASRGRRVGGIDEPGAHAYLYRLDAAHW